jgi:hypothetical protein
MCSPLHDQNVSTRSAAKGHVPSSSIVLRWQPSASSSALMPRASRHVPQTPTSPPRRVIALHLLPALVARSRIAEQKHAHLLVFALRDPSGQSEAVVAALRAAARVVQMNMSSFRVLPTGTRRVSTTKRRPGQECPTGVAFNRSL